MFAKIGLAIAAIIVVALVVLIVLRLLDDRHVNQIWRSLEVEPTNQVFSEEMVSGLPPLAQRYFLHAIEPGTPLASSVQLKMSGSLRLDENSAWMPVTAREILTPHRGFVWKARVQNGPVLLIGADHYSKGSGRLRFNLFGLIPLVNAGGPDISRATIGRLMGESIWVPAALLPQREVVWETIDDERLNATFTVDGETSTLTFVIDTEGRVREISMRRWDNRTENGEYAYIPYGIVVDEEQTFGGYTIPTRVRAIWWYGTERSVEVIRFNIEEAHFE